MEELKVMKEEYEEKYQVLLKCKGKSVMRETLVEEMKAIENMPDGTKKAMAWKKMQV